MSLFNLFILIQFPYCRLIIAKAVFAVSFQDGAIMTSLRHSNRLGVNYKYNYGDCLKHPSRPLPVGIYLFYLFICAHQVTVLYINTDRILY